jgi:hypothetical protein
MAWRGQHVGAQRRRRSVGLGLCQAQGGATALLHGLAAATTCWTVRGELRRVDEIFFTKKLGGGTAQVGRHEAPSLGNIFILDPLDVDESTYKEFINCIQM